MNDFVAGGHAEICFNLFYTGFKKKKKKAKKPFLMHWEALIALIDYFFFPVNKGKFKETLPESAVDV